MNPAPADEVRALSIPGALRRNWWVVLGCGVVLACLAAAATWTGSPTYTASTTVFLQPIAGNALSPDATVNGQQVLVAMETEASMVDSPGVVDKASADLGLPADEVRGAVSASIPTNTKTVEIAFRAGSAEAARAGATEVATAFLAFRQDQATEATRRQMAKLTAQSEAAYRSLKKLPPGGLSDSANKASQQVLASRLASIQSSIAQLVSSDTFPGTVSRAATLPRKPDGLDPVVALSLATLLGLALGAALAVWRQARRDTVSVSEGPTVAGVPVLASVRGPGVPEPRRTPGLVARDDVRESFRQLQIGVRSSAPAATTFSISHVSAGRPIGSVTATLGITMATTGLRVVMVDACPPGSPGGLVEVLGDQLAPATKARAARRVTVAGDGDLVVLSPATPGVGQPMVDRPRLARLTADEARGADVVLVAAPSLVTADGELTCMATEATVLVVDQERTKTSDVEAVVQRAALVGVEVCGVFTVPAGARSRSRHDRAPKAFGRLFSRRGRPALVDGPAGRSQQVWRASPVADES